MRWAVGERAAGGGRRGLRRGRGPRGERTRATCVLSRGRKGSSLRSATLSAFFKSGAVPRMEEACHMPSMLNPS